MQRLQLTHFYKYIKVFFRHAFSYLLSVAFGNVVCFFFGCSLLSIIEIFYFMFFFIGKTLNTLWRRTFRKRQNRIRTLQRTVLTIYPQDIRQARRSNIDGISVFRNSTLIIDAKNICSTLNYERTQGMQRKRYVHRSTKII